MGFPRHGITELVTLSDCVVDDPKTACRHTMRYQVQAVGAIIHEIHVHPFVSNQTRIHFGTEIVNVHQTVFGMLVESAFFFVVETMTVELIPRAFACRDSNPGVCLHV